MKVLELAITVFCSVLASSGFWGLMMKRAERRDGLTEMVMGLGHDRVMFLGMRYIARGYITKDEFENLYEYLYKPYLKIGGNGSAKRIMDEVGRLPIREHPDG